MSLAFTKCYTAYSEPTGLAASALGFDTKTCYCYQPFGINGIFNWHFGKKCPISVSFQLHNSGLGKSTFSSHW